MWSTAPDTPRRRRRRPVAKALALLLVGAWFIGTAAWGQTETRPADGADEQTAAPEQRAGSTETPLAKSTARVEASAEAPVTGGGLRVFVDPETGEILAQPRAEQLLELQALERQRLASPTGAIEQEPVRVFAIPGGVGADLPPSTMSSTVLKVLPDGTFETLCVDHSAHADHAHPIADGERPKTADREEVR